MFFVLVDIGCIECGEPSHCIGIFTDLTKAKELLKHYEEKQAREWMGQHNFEIFNIEEIDKEYVIESFTW